MEQTKIFRYVDNLDVNTQADLLKKLLDIIINEIQIRRECQSEAVICVDDLLFIEKQIEEFNEQYRVVENGT